MMEKTRRRQGEDKGWNEKNEWVKNDKGKMEKNERLKGKRKLKEIKPKEGISWHEETQPHIFIYA